MENVGRLYYTALNKKIAVEELDAHEFAEFLTFDDKPTYLEWVANWKKEYAELSTEIRNLKVTRRDLQRAGNAEMAPDIQSKCEKKGHEARCMLAVRKAGKAYSWALKQEAKFELAV